MPITVTTVVIMIAVCIIGLACWAVEALFVHLDRQDQAEAGRVYSARHDRAVPRQRDPDWDAIAAIIEEDKERIATTGELRRLYQRPYPGLSDTAELRALAEAGDVDGIDGILTRWAAENLTEGEAA
jgi:hypothetical protein